MAATSGIPTSLAAPASSSGGTTILALPAEILIHAFAELGPGDLLRCQQVCRSFRRLVRTSALRYKLHLACAAMRDGATRGHSSFERLAALRHYQTAWDAGVLAPQRLTNEEDDRVHHVQCFPFTGGVFPVLTGSQLDLYRSSSHIRRIEPNHWTLDVTPTMIELHVIAVDIAQALVVISGSLLDSPHHLRYCLLSLTPTPRNPYHPLAPQPTVTIPSGNDMMFGYCEQLAITNNLVGWVICLGFEYELRVYNWKEGTLLWILPQRPPIYFTFLGYSHVVICNWKGLHLYALDPHEEKQDARCTGVLQFLEFATGTSRWPLITQVESHAPGASFDGEGLFQYDPDCTLLAVTFTVEMPGEVETRVREYFVLLVPFSTLLAEVQVLDRTRTPADSAGERSTHTVDWHAWGCEGARLLRIRRPYELHSITALGPKCAVVFATREELPNTTMRIFVFDVHPWAARLHRTADEDFEQAAQFFEGWDGFQGMDHIFASPLVESKMPFRLTHRRCVFSDETARTSPFRFPALMDDGLAMIFNSEPEIVGPGSFYMFSV